MKDDRAKNPALALLLGILIPGLGHAYVGRKGKGLFFLAILVGTFFFGWALGGFRNVYFEPRLAIGEFRWAVLAQVPIGIPAAGAFLLSPAPDFKKGSTDTSTIISLWPGYGVGTLYTCVAGLLNAVVALDAMRQALRAKSLPEKPVHPIERPSDD